MLLRLTKKAGKMELKSIVESLIRKVVYPLKEGKELEMALKAKLTKKELKALKSMVDGSYVEDFEEIKVRLIKKLNQEKVKQFLYKGREPLDKKE